MKKVFLLLLLSSSLFSDSILFAQKKIKTFEFIYVAHNMDTPITTLINKLHDLYYTKVSEYEAKEVDACIFYLAKGHTPKIVTVNLGADENLPNNNREKIEEWLSELNKPDYRVEPYSDVDSIIKIFNQYDFLNETGHLKYEKIKFNFYVDNEFWEGGYNESLIARLYWILGLDRFKDNFEFEWRVWCSEKLHKKLEDEEFYFGETNWGDINNDFRPLLLKGDDEY